ncbi:SDR family NAD(P)-dependent oxidoreductase [Nocardioides marmoriginsengisoli]|uniref:SDR family NAD(P)-dependent oxidoreductase n=1 Tax=Nocardioides marmoriginsengisoli TaxID=661483 RepID=A0A3N0CII7_9ACTN|nr:SDR family NAD(P)-dependent oxidoreductase [Nocardioides marmoriginsengisoli]RNL63254.1 SDR family NAD(P)-dependent oxidoreductase [Nocardioides marmoriginsengisoli]
MRVVVTGAGPDSIGLATARALRDLGHEVLVSTRSTPVDGFAWHPLDLADRASVAAFADWVGSGPLDALVNNAGIHLDLRATWKEPKLLDGHEIHWRTNYLGTMQLTEALLPAVLSAGAVTGDARIVHVVSYLHTRGRNEFLFDGVAPYSSWKAYGTTKLALMHDAARLSGEYADRGLRAVSVHPGKVLTKIADGGLANTPVLAKLRSFARPVEKLLLLTPEQGAETTVHTLTTADLVPGGYYAKSALAEPSADARDASVRDRLRAETTAWLEG